MYCLKNLELVSRYKKKNYILCILKAQKKILINLKIIYKAPINFSIIASAKNKVISLSPIEELSEFTKLESIKRKNYNFYKPILKNKIFDYSSNFKPGFYNQYKKFFEFTKNTNKKIINDVIFARNIFKLTKKIIY